MTYEDLMEQPEREISRTLRLCWAEFGRFSWVQVWLGLAWREQLVARPTRDCRIWLGLFGLGVFGLGLRLGLARWDLFSSCTFMA